MVQQMKRNGLTSRRGFLKKTAVATGASGLLLKTGTTRASARNCGSYGSQLDVSGFNGGGDYVIYLNDSKASEGSNTETGDNVYNRSGYSKIVGTVANGTDSYYFDGYINKIVAKGDMTINPRYDECDGYDGVVTVTGHGDYYVQFEDNKQPQGRNGTKESNDTTGVNNSGDGFIDGVVRGGKDEFRVYGEINWSRWNIYNGRRITLEYNHW